MNILRSIYRRTPVYDVVQQRRSKAALRHWEQAGRPVPPPHASKAAVVREYGRRHNIPTLVETGTLFGEMIYAVRNDFTRIYSIEIDDDLYNKAVRRFRGYPNVTLLKGDSGAVLPELMGKLDGPALFWLDGHYSGGITGKGAEVSPAASELRAIWERGDVDHVILLDDARLFRAEEGYPDLSELRAYVATHRPQWDFYVADDIIRIHRKLDDSRPACP